MVYLDKTTHYDRLKGYIDFKCLHCNEPVRVNDDGEPYSGITYVKCPYCGKEIELETCVEVSYVPSIHLPERKCRVCERKIIGYHDHEI